MKYTTFGMRKKGEDIGMRFARTLVLAGVLTAGMAVAAACSSGEDAEEQAAPDNQETEEDTENNEEVQAPSAELSSNEDLKEQLESEESVEEAMVQQVDGEDGQTINIDISIAAGQELSDDMKSAHSDMIREVYPDQTVDVIYAQEGEMLEQATLE